MHASGAPRNKCSGEDGPVELAAHLAQPNLKASEAINPGGLEYQVVAFSALELTKPKERKASSVTRWAHEPRPFTPEMDRREVQIDLDLFTVPFVVT